VSSPSQIIAVSPPAGAGPVDVQVTTAAAGVSAAVPAGAFTYASAPTVTIAAVSEREPTSTTLHGTVNSNGLPLAGCQFQYGTTPGYGQTAACAQTVSATSLPTAVSALLKGLVPATKYHYRLAVTTAAGASNGPDETFTTPQLQVVGTPLIGLLLERVASRPGLIGKLLGIQGITRAVPGESIAVRCVKACSHALVLKIALNARVMPHKLTLAHALLLSGATRIEIEVSASGKLSRYARYAFSLAGPNLAVRITDSGCLTTAGKTVTCDAQRRQARG
jgi:hypothetical protein